ncbi:MAG: endonuclease/exonuclease/phosphatase family protein [Phycisphaerae bacterium]
MRKFLPDKLLLLAVASGLLAGCAKEYRPLAYEPETHSDRLTETLGNDPAQTMRIGSWNLYWFGTPEERNRPETEKDVRAMARYIQDSGVSVLAMQELRADPEPDGQSIQTVLDMLPGRWKHLIFPPNKTPGQATGIAWDADRVTLLERIELQVDRNPPGWQEFARQFNQTDENGQPVPIHNRKVMALHFSAGPGLTDFVVIPIHLISALKGFHVSRVRRYYEMATILDRVAERFLLQGEMDVILIGDTNCAADALEAFELAGGEETSASRYARNWAKPYYFHELGGDADQETYISDPPGTPNGRAKTWPLDRAYVPARQCEFHEAELVIFDSVQSYAKDKADFIARLSDHFLVYHTIRVMGDDDRVFGASGLARQDK